MIQQFHLIYIQKNESKVLKRYLYIHVYSNIIHNSQNVGLTHLPISR